MRYEEVKMGDLKTADQIAVCGNVRDLNPLLVPLAMLTDDKYFHHGIFDRENLAVYDFYGDSKENARPQRRDFTEFFKGHEILFRVVYEDGEQCLPADEVMKRAKDAVKNQSSWPCYNLVKNNCESFATFVKTGKLYSEQAITAVKEVCKKVVPYLATAAGSLAAAGFIALRFK